MPCAAAGESVAPANERRPPPFAAGYRGGGASRLAVGRRSGGGARRITGFACLCLSSLAGVHTHRHACTYRNAYTRTHAAGVATRRVVLERRPSTPGEVAQTALAGRQVRGSRLAGPLGARLAFVPQARCWPQMAQMARILRLGQM